MTRIQPANGKTLQASLMISLTLHSLVFLGVFILNRNLNQAPILQLREIDIVEVEELQEIIEPEPVVQKQKLFDFVKEVIPVKRKPKPAVRRTSARTAPLPQPRVIVPAGPLIAKKAVLDTAPAGGAAQPVISKNSLGTGTMTGAPKWEKGPGERLGGGGRNLNLGLSTMLPEARRRNVADVEVAASLQGRRGGLSLHTSNDVNAIVANVGQRKSLGLAGNRAGNAAELKGFRDAFAVFGEIKNRKIIKIKMPKYPAWAEEQGIEASARIRVGVLADGTVDETSIYVESTSGYPELDNLAIAAAKQFIFAALPSSKSQVVQYGSIRFAFQLKH